MKQSVELLLSLVLALGLFGATANAATESGGMPQSKSAMSIKFVSGGASPEGRQHMQRMAGDFDLMLTLQAAKDNEDYTKAKVSVQEQGGKELLNAMAGGPLFYVQIPPGEYKVSVDLDGKQLVKTAHVAPNESTKLTFDWRT